MSKLYDLLSQAAVIRDATDEKENTALRVGTMFVDFIQACLEVLPYEIINASLTTCVEGETSFVIHYGTVDYDGQTHTRHITIPLVSSNKAGLMSPAMIDEFNQALTNLQNSIIAINNALGDLKEVFLTQAEYDAMVDAGTIDPNTKYYIYEDCYSRTNIRSHGLVLGSVPSTKCTRVSASCGASFPIYGSTVTYGVITNNGKIT